MLDRDFEKKKTIRQWFADGKIKRLSTEPRSYSVPSGAFVMGITPWLVAQTLDYHPEPWMSE